MRHIIEGIDAVGKVRDALRFFAVEKTVESRLLKNFGSIDKIRVSLGKVGFMG